MVVAMALMTGYREDLQDKLIRGNAAVVAYPVGGARLDPKREARLRAIPGVLGIGHVAYGQGSLASSRRPQGIEVVLRGVDAGAGQFSARADQLGEGPDGIPHTLLGADLGKKLGVREGDVLRLVVLGFSGEQPRFRYQSVRVAGTFATGFAEFDRSWVLLGRTRVEQLMGHRAALDLLEFTLADPHAAPATAETIGRVLQSDFVVTDWQQLNRELFAALRLQQIVLFLVLGLIVLVSTFNVGSTLVVLVRERMRDIGVLGALGLAPRRLRSLFLLYGAFLGGVGTLLGIAIGAGIAWTLTTFKLIRFDPEVAAIYFVDSVPFRVRPFDLLGVVGFTVLVTLLASWVPAWRAGRIRPADALRYE